MFVWFYERKLIYFPYKILEYTPDVIGLKWEDIEVVTDDGIRLNGWYIPALDSICTLIFAHGNAGNISHRLDKIIMFYKRNISVFIFDYRGYGKSGGRPSEKGLYLDGLAAYNYLVNKRGVQPEDIVVYGESIGSAIVSYIASKNRVRAIILESPFTNARDMSTKILPFLPVKYFVTIKFDIMSMLKDVEDRILIIHGNKDEIVPFLLGKKLFDSLKTKNKEFYEVPEAGHNDVSFVGGDRYFDRIKEFILANRDTE
ncbi:MAG: alpha/beta hydrolase [Candidatus Hydrogenedentota bacterium]